MNTRLLCGLFLVAATACGEATRAATIDDLTQWTLVEDPPHAGMTATVDNPAQATLTASGSIPTGTDIGYQSVDGADVAGSTSGYYFSPGSDFSVAIDFDFSEQSSFGGGGIGFGIGEDGDGTDSAGVGMAFVSGSPTAFVTAGRVNDADVPLQLFSSAATASGRFFVEYDSATADVILGVSAVQGASSPTEVKTLTGVQDQWDDEPLLVSFFLRSQGVSLIPPLTSGEASAVFGNLEVLSGTPLSVPEPTSALLAALALVASWRSPRYARG